ncbi:unnamed protein product, partial [Ixodes pacificus]
MGSSFPFDNFMQSLKKRKRKPERPFIQHRNRIVEERSLALENKTCKKIKYSLEHETGPLPTGCRGPQYNKVSVAAKFVLRGNNRDSTLLLNDGTFIQLEHIAFCETTGEVCIVGRKYCSNSDLYNYPCDSFMLGIYLASNLSYLQSSPLSHATRKCYVFHSKAKVQYFNCCMRIMSEVRTLVMNLCLN